MKHGYQHSFQNDVISSQAITVVTAVGLSAVISGVFGKRHIPILNLQQDQGHMISDIILHGRILTDGLLMEWM